jgi:hypothetical protein
MTARGYDKLKNQCYSWMLSLQCKHLKIADDMNMELTYKENNLHILIQGTQMTDRIVLAA